jgi:hypothetical protein
MTYTVAVYSYVHFPTFGSDCSAYSMPPIDVKRIYVNAAAEPSAFSDPRCGGGSSSRLFCNKSAGLRW